MVFPVLVEANRNIGGVGMFDEVSIFSVDGQNQTDKFGDKVGDSVQTLSQCFVGAVRFDDFKQRLFGLNVLFLLEESQRDGIDKRD